MLGCFCLSDWATWVLSPYVSIILVDNSLSLDEVDFCDIVKKSFKRAGVDLFTISTEEALVGAIVRMAALRKKRRK